jgi:geranylgeranylglycerol-phosphate geranylgeranyltransferase
MHSISSFQKVIIPNPLEVKDRAIWVCKAWAFLWLIRLVPSSVASLAVLAGFRLSADAPKTGALVLAVGSTFLITSGGFAWNEYCDRETDVLNLPYRPLPSGILSPRQALLFAAMALTGGEMLAFGLGLKGVVYYTIAALSLLAYTPLVKPLPGVKNVYVAAYCASLLMFGGYLGGNISRTVAPALVAIPCVTAREMLMDIRDIVGDKCFGYCTLPVLLGSRPSRLVAAVLLGLAAALQASLLSGLTRGYLGEAALLASLVCFAVVASMMAFRSSLSTTSLTAYVRMLMVGILLGVVSLAF